ncbi:MAG: nucleotidyl transferase AbiEii/AbiGii toxin family protein [Actinomycetota bacterium]|nr:nucleotidyl transferase AbiEii/AbiGii toxin family protein [Actinomycetota bacterium]
MITLGRITQQADADGVDADTVERDYVLTQVIASLSHHPDNDIFQFKGGTLLRLCYFSEYRYSADIDLNLKPDVDIQQAIDVLGEILEATQERVGLPHLALATEPKLRIEFIGPKRTARPRIIKLDISTDELILDGDESRRLLHRYEDQPETHPIRTYGLPEATAEKLRCVMQRLQCRDLYDIWYLLGEAGVDATDIRRGFERKAEHRGLEPAFFAQRFEQRIESYEQRWEDELVAYMTPVPDIDRVVREVRRNLRQANYL